RQGGIAPVCREIRAHLLPWLGWSGVGYALFYIGLIYAASNAASGRVAGTFQLIVVAGKQTATLPYDEERRRNPMPALAIGLLVVAGVMLMQFGVGGGSLDRDGWIALGWVAVAAVAYPLGNRGLLLHLERRGGPVQLNATQRVFGLTLASQPAWIVL